MSSTVKSSAALSALSVFSSVLNMLSYMVLARVFGAGEAIDAYFVGLSIPLLVGGILAGAISYQAVPMLIHFAGTATCSKREYRDSLLFMGAVSGVIIAVLGAIGSIALIRGYPNGREYIEHSAGVIAAFGWGGVCVGVVMALLIAINHTQKRFLRPAFLNNIPPLCAISAGLSVGRFGGTPLAVAGALLVGQAAGLVILAWRMWKEIRPFQVRKSGLRHVIRDMKTGPWVLASMLVFTIYGTIDAYLGAHLSTGSVTCIAYGQRIVVALAGLGVNGASVVMMPRFAEAAAKGARSEMLRDTVQALKAIILITVPVTIAVACFAEGTTRIVFGGGRFDVYAVRSLSEVLPYLITGMVPMACATILFRNLYAARDGIAVAVIGVGGGLSYSILAAGLIFGTHQGIRSFGIAYTINWSLVTGVAFWRVCGTAVVKQVWMDCKSWILRACVAAVFAIAAGEVVVHAISAKTMLGELVAIAVAYTTVVLAFGAGAYGFRLIEVQSLRLELSNILNKKSRLR